MRNPAVEALDVLIGDWDLTLANAAFFEGPDVRVHGRAKARWLADAFVELDVELDGEPLWHFVFGRSDPGEQLYALYHDPRPTSRLFHTTFAGGEWRMLRQDADFHQRFVATVQPDRIDGHWDMSEDRGATWRKDFDVIFERTAD